MSSIALSVMSSKRPLKTPPRDPQAEWEAFLRSVGATLAAERRARDLTQQQVAERLQVEPETVSRIETGAIAPTLQRLRQFAEVFGCPMESLIGKTSDQASDVAKRLAQDLAELGPADRAFVAAQTQALVEFLKAGRRRGN